MELRGPVGMCGYFAAAWSCRHRWLEIKDDFIVGAVVATFRGVLKLGSLLVVVAFVAGGVWFFATEVDREVGVRVRGLLAEHYSQYTVRVGSARRVEGQGIEIRDISISDPATGGLHAEILHIEEVLLGCNTDIVDLVRNRLNARCVTLRGVTLRPTRRQDGSWNVAGLWPLPQRGNRTTLIPVTVERARVEIRDMNNDAVDCFELRDINLALTPSARKRTGETPENEKCQGPPPQVVSEKASETTTPVLAIACQFGGNYVRSADLSGYYDPDKERGSG